MLSFIVSREDLDRCTVHALTPEHFREDGTCRCDEAPLPLTFDDPEPPVWSWVQDENGDLWRRTHKGWCHQGVGLYEEWSWLVGYHEVRPAVLDTKSESEIG